ncbi:MAG: glycosyltransferase [Planctomycetes bacterium]|nr:glycosyltransferase [Planctomycetota bacterium]
MNVGNADFNNLFNPTQKKYFFTAEEINEESDNNSLSFLVKNVRPGSTVLDVGCSFGYIGDYLAAKKKCIMYGIEINSAAIEHARKNGAYRDIYEINMENASAEMYSSAGFRNSPLFDCILCGDILEHLCNINDAFFALMNKLKPGGRMLISLPNMSNFEVVLGILAGRFNYSDFGILDSSHLRFFTKRSFVEWLDSLNRSSNNWQVEIELYDKTTAESASAMRLKTECPAAYEKIMRLYADSGEAPVYQHLFVLRKDPPGPKIDLCGKMQIDVNKDVVSNFALHEKDSDFSIMIKEKNACIAEKELRISCLEDELIAYRNSTGVRFYESAKNLLKKLFLYKYILLAKKALFYIKTYGFRVTWQKTKEKIALMTAFGSIEEKWMSVNEPGKTELETQKKIKFPDQFKISIIMPVYNTEPGMLKAAIDSVLRQTYANWELCIADGGSTSPQIKEILNSYSSNDVRIKVKFLDANRGIAGNTNEALAIAGGEFAAFLDHDDTLAPFALFEITKAVNKDHTIDFIYSDEDKLSENGGKRFKLNFKPSWSPDLLRSNNYITHLTAIKKTLIDKIGGFRQGFDGAQDYDLILRATEKANKIHRIPAILYHWRTHEKSTADNPSAKTGAYEAGRRAVEEHLSRSGLRGRVENGAFAGAYKVTYDMPVQPKISIIIPNKDSLNLIQRCVNSILDRSIYKNYEILIVENHSEDRKTFEYYDKLTREHENVRILKWDKPFNFSDVNNFAVSHTQGEIVLLLNNDVEVINPDWLERMAEHAVRKEVGAVGAKLYYPNNTIQHAGVIVGLGGVAGHSHKHHSRDSFGYFGRLVLTQNLSAVTAACVMMRKEVFLEAGGFDEKFALSFGDVDLCLKIRKKGYRIVWTPYAELYHYESVTRGHEDTPQKQARFNTEIKTFRRKWMDFLEEGDPFYNPNLTIATEDFKIKL